MFSVRSGETFINPSTCSRCLCRNGDEVLCQRLPAGSCDEFNPTPGPDRPRDCTIRGRTLSDGDSLTVSWIVIECGNGLVMVPLSDIRATTKVSLFKIYSRWTATAVDAGMENLSVLSVTVKMMRRKVMMKRIPWRLGTAEHVVPCEPHLCVVTMAVLTLRDALLLSAVDWMLMILVLVPALEE